MDTYLLARIQKRGSRSPGNVFCKRCCCLLPWLPTFSPRFPTVFAEVCLLEMNVPIDWLEHPLYTAASVWHFILLCRQQNVIEKSDFLPIAICAGECMPLSLHQPASPYYTQRHHAVPRGNHFGSSRPLKWHWSILKTFGLSPFSFGMCLGGRWYCCSFCLGWMGGHRKGLSHCWDLWVRNCQ